MHGRTLCTYTSAMAITLGCAFAMPLGVVWKEQAVSGSGARVKEQDKSHKSMVAESVAGMLLQRLTIRATEI